MPHKRAPQVGVQTERADGIELLPQHLQAKPSLQMVDLREILCMTAAGVHKQINDGKWPPPLKIGTRSIWPTSLVAAELKKRLDVAQKKHAARAAVSS